MSSSRSIRQSIPRAFILVALLAFQAVPEPLAQQEPAQRYPCEDDLIEVMFAPDARVRLRGGELVDLTTDAVAGVSRVLESVTSFEWSRICDVEEAVLDAIQARGETNTGQPVYNLNNIYRLRFVAEQEAVDVWGLSRDLEALPGIIWARPVPKPMPLPLPPDYEPQQGYLDPAAATPTGIDAEYAWTQPGGDGTGITVVDIEYSWNYEHDDVTKALGSQIVSLVQDPFADNNHGTAVAGELVADRNGWGISGVCYGASLLTAGSYFGSPVSWNPAGAIATSIAHSNPGDVILLEQQWDYYGTQGIYVPVEWYGSTWPSPQTMNPVYVAIVNATASNIYVVEAGGNGGYNTGGMTWVGDSQAVIVGAGGANPGGTYPEGDLERLSLSSYGPRFNLQGWGEDVLTTGYGDLFASEGPHRIYRLAFSGTSSASPIVAGAIACCAGYYRANISMTPITPVAMRNLLVSTGTPQVFGPPGHIGPRPNCLAAIQAMGGVTYDGDWGDAPEYALAYPAAGGMGFFPTCSSAGPTGSFVLHLNMPPYLAHFGPAEEAEADGNAGNCPNFPPYDADECFRDGDAGLLFPAAFTIQGGAEVPCPGSVGSAMPPIIGIVCMTASWGSHVDIDVTNTTIADVYVNVLMDWNGDGIWQGSATCPGLGPAPEHVLVNFPVPPGFSGPLSRLAPPSFLTGPNAGFFWTRFTVSDSQVPQDWDGAGTFALGETEDYLLQLAEEPELRGDYGDAPEGSLAYPSTGLLGDFPTCFLSGQAGFVLHGPFDPTNGFFGNSNDYEFEGNAGNCPNFPPYDADECFQDGDAGLMVPPAYTIQGGLVVPCSGISGSLGGYCQTAVWGTNVDIWVDTRGCTQDMYVNVLMDWSQDGRWQGLMQCPGGAAPEHVLWNFPVPVGYLGPLSGLTPPPFQIGPASGVVWTRFTLSDLPVPFDWNGQGCFAGGESEDYLLKIDSAEAPEGDYGDAPEGVPAYPWLGVQGRFPTCFGTGPATYVFHIAAPYAYFGPVMDPEPEGNAGNCPNWPPYDADECFGDGDAGLIMPPGYTIDPAGNPIACDPTQTGSLGMPCQQAVWGLNVDIMVTNILPVEAFVNVVIDWDQNGMWGGASACPGGAAPEHVLVNFVVPRGYTGPLSGLNPPPFLIGPNSQYVWARFTIGESAMPPNWNGAGFFETGESEDYLLMVGIVQEEGEYGDAPEGAMAYPDLGIMGDFPTCTGVLPEGFVMHAPNPGPFFGPMLEWEPDGNAGNCPNFPPYDADECFADGDAGLLLPPAYTIDPLLNYAPCQPGATGSLGQVCTGAAWGTSVDIHVTNPLPIDVFVNVLMDWNRDGKWFGVSPCPGPSPAPEHVLVNFVVPAGFVGPLSALGPPPFVIGPLPDYIWTRFTISAQIVPSDWNGDGVFETGETEDYLLLVLDELPPPTGACCFTSPEAFCQVLSSLVCQLQGGTYQGDNTPCDPNPCPYNQQRVCCVGTTCQLVWSEQECEVGLSGVFHPEYLTCQPNPCTTCIHWATHNVGDGELTVTDQGIIGFMDDTQAEGVGFIYPATGDNLLFVGSLWVSNDSVYVANREYTADPEKEWAYSLVPLGCIWTDTGPTAASDQDIHSIYRDRAGTDSLQLLVRQDSWAWSAPDPADDFVILRYVIRNESSATLTDLYAGVFCDFDIGSSYQDDVGAVDANLQVVYMTDAAGVHAGVVKLDRAGDPGLANLTLVHNPVYVWPQQYMLDADKYKFLSAFDATHVVTVTASADDHSLLASAGPFTLGPGQTDSLAFALVGGTSSQSFFQNAAVAQLVYEHGIQGVDDPWTGPVAATRLLASRPNPFSGATTVFFEVSATEPVSLAVYDVSGRLVQTLMKGEVSPGRYHVTWRGVADDNRPVAAGVYYVRLVTRAADESRPVILLR